jgi:hypothetical protein
MIRLSKVVFGLTAALAMIALTATMGAAAANPYQSAEAPQAHNMRLVGYNDLGGRAAYHPWVQKQGNRYILYAAHHTGYRINRLTGIEEANGTSIIDVTNPARPVYLYHIPGAPAPDNEARHARTCQVGGRWYLLRTTGQISHDLYDVTNPAAPTFKKTIVGDRFNGSSALTYTHKPWWDCETGYMFLPSSSAKNDPNPWRTAPTTGFVKIYWQNPADINDTQFVRDFGINGQQPALYGGSGTVPTGIHMPLGSKNHDRIYIGWGSGGNGIAQITDYFKLVGREPGNSKPWPIEPTTANLNYPVLGRIDFPSNWGAHTVFEMKGVYLPDFALGQVASDAVKDFAVIVSEAGGFKCSNERDITFIYDITNPAKPVAASTFQVPAAMHRSCEKGGRFGPHSGQDRYDGPFYNKLYTLAYFNAGVRVVDIRNPFNPVEVAHYIADPNQNTLFCATVSGVELCDNFATQANNTDTDDRGLVYIVDRAGTGTHILELTGDAKKILNGPVPAP